ncbi:MAG: DegT/DnrJ/EryC1/StrS family aminotransferase [Candidatus Eremiobacteraeota bacterium]|nr:DegT/DnrJ/EryC1/StrS family aminotransferase [Candidatus Eremiobacteraeota bacterium]
MHNLADLSHGVLKLPSDQDASGRSLDRHELALLREALNSGTLTSTKGTFVRTLQQRFASLLNVRHAFACASGTAAVHCAVAALDPEPGDEIITSPITDMGALAPILYQGAIPVFADVDVATCNLTARTIRERLSERTRAIVVTHLFGNPCDMSDILALAAQHGIAVIEDCAQAFLASDRGRLAGSMGSIGCFSLQQGKHITTGEGGLVVTNDPSLARRLELFINKAWGYGDTDPDHYFLALNYRMSELQGAVGVAQLDKLDLAVRRRISLANKLTSQLRDVPGVDAPVVRPQSRHVFWKYCIRVDKSVLPDGVTQLAARLKDRGIAAAPRYIQKPAFRCAVFSQQRTFGTSRYPFTLARPEAVDYSAERFRGTFAALDGIIVIPWNDRYTDDHVDYIAGSIRDAALSLRSSA